MMRDALVNPYSHDWNAVLLRYCDGASFIGDTVEAVPYSGDSLYFRGWRNLQATITDLIKNHGLADATEVLIGGDSAGGLATFMHVDYMASEIHAAGSKAYILGMPDSGFWPDSASFAGKFRTMLSVQNGTAGLLPPCLAAHPGETEKCLFPENFAQLVQTPLFPIQSLYDPLQSKCPGGPQARGLEMLQQMTSTVLARQRRMDPFMRPALRCHTAHHRQRDIAWGHPAV